MFANGQILKQMFYFADNKELIETVLFNQGALQEYIVTCCQAPEGGLIDKPGK